MDFYGTIGPACAELSTLQQMVRAGMTGLRMNLSHGSLAEHADWLELIQKAGIRTLLIDLQGPELRIGRLASPLTLSEGQQVFLGTAAFPARLPFGRHNPGAEAAAGRRQAAFAGERCGHCSPLHRTAGRSAPEPEEHRGARAWRFPPLP